MDAAPATPLDRIVGWTTANPVPLLLMPLAALLLWVAIWRIWLPPPERRRDRPHRDDRGRERGRPAAPQGHDGGRGRPARPRPPRRSETLVIALVFLAVGIAVVGLFHDRIASFELDRDGFKIDLTKPEKEGAPSSSNGSRGAAPAGAPTLAPSSATSAPSRRGALPSRRRRRRRRSGTARRRGAGTGPGHRRRADVAGTGAAAARSTLVRVTRIVAHLDLDAFFAAVEELERPELRTAAARRRRRPARPRRGRDGELRRAAVRHRVGDVVRRGAPPLPARGVRAPARIALPRALAARCGRSSARSCRRSSRRGSTRATSTSARSRRHSTTRARSPRPCGRSSARGRGCRARSASRRRRSSRRSRPTAASPAG